MSLKTSPFSTMKSIAIVLARSGSKRIPGKNTRLFRERPMMAWPLQAALDSGLFDEVMVSTDGPEIAELAVNMGASVPFMRSAEAASDVATTADVLTEVLRSYGDLGQKFDLACCLYAAAPFVTIELLRQSRQILFEENFDVVMPVTSFSYPILRSLQREPGGKVAMNWPEYVQTRSQDLPAAYHDVGQFYWFRPAALARDGTLLGQNTGSVVVPESQVQDIDNEEDWLMAELKHQRRFG
ncbi:pseudaminic acid cytidylyltransferase [Paraburkholderia sp.]|uniref:pseudaminic acid cytidylyltransferase n=1 Tax=Paraburkholderia sp. TaxID=1926495 RepID=UPI0025D616BB|nr:pseudaminic acid cytidylyltransferase [Paraburkholderia sp.]